jgi:hypothetical protein
MACGPRAKMVEALTSKYNERQFARGMADRNVVEFWVNSQTRSWTVLGIMPNGMACIAAAGQNFETSEPPKPKPDIGT